MDLSMRMRTLVVGALAAAAFSGCSVAVEPLPLSPPVTVPSESGTVTINWLVAGRTDASICDGYGATHLEIVIDDRSGAMIARQYAPCGRFTSTVPLPVGAYSAEVTLVGPSNEAISVTKQLAAIDVVAGTDLAINVDFPSSSML
jgi:hypothetical protein